MRDFSKKKLIVANWKAYLDEKESLDLCLKLKKIDFENKKIKLTIAPNPAVLNSIKSKISGSRISLCAQDVFPAWEGAYTGSVTAKYLKEAKVKYCIVGHSERRIYQHETNSIINKKIKELVLRGITPILCAGENLKQHKQGNSYKIVTNQIKECLKGVKIKNLIFAYEPQWAISGFKGARCAKADYIENLNAKFKKFFGKGIAVIYGGSVDQDNIDVFLHSANIDGLLIGKKSTSIELYKKLQ